MVGYVLINIPKDCGTCPLCEFDYDWLGMLSRAVCKREMRHVEVYCGEERPQFCPIKPLPTTLGDTE